MDSSSSISSSESRPDPLCPGVGRGAPWAALLALVMVGAVELAVRRVEPDKLIDYESTQEDRYTVRDCLYYFGCPEVTFIGSSRSVNAFVMPDINAALQKRLGRPVKAVNYALGGMNMPEQVPMLGFLLRHPPLPRVLVWGVDQEFLGGKTDYLELSAIFWSFSDWIGARRRFGPGVDPLLPEVIRGFVSDHYATFRHRERPLDWVKERVRGRLPSRFRGELIYHEQVVEAGRTLINHPVDEAMTAFQVCDGHLAPDGSYPFRPERLAAMRDVLDRCCQAGIHVVLVELPNPDVFQRWFPSDVGPRFDLAMRDMAAQTGAMYVSLKDLGLGFDTSEYRDPWHLSFQGAKRLSQTFVDRFLAAYVAGVDPLRPP